MEEGSRDVSKWRQGRARESFKLSFNENLCYFHLHVHSFLTIFIYYCFYTPLKGSFRLCCEHVLKSLKRGRETLLTLLEAFVYDPLIDWAIGEDNNATGGLANISGGQKGNSSAGEISAARKLLEREVTRDTLAIRFTEIKNDWTQNRWVIFFLSVTD